MKETGDRRVSRVKSARLSHVPKVKCVWGAKIPTSLSSEGQRVRKKAKWKQLQDLVSHRKALGLFPQNEIRSQVVI